jgi:thiol-disulfide isomerase/thioredoxin
MTDQTSHEQPKEPVTLADDGPTEHGRVGYGRFARYSPIALAVAIVAVLLIAGLIDRKPEKQPTQVGKMIGQQAPDFDLTLLDGTNLNLTALEGNVVVLNFWASWCAPCKEEMPLLQQLAADARTRGDSVQVVGIGLKRDYDENARKFVADLGITFPVGRDTAGDDEVHGPIETAYGVSNYPTTVFIRSDGTVDSIHIGQLSAEDFTGAVLKAQE